MGISLLWHSENKKFGDQIFKIENIGSSVEKQGNLSKTEAQGNLSKIGLFSWQIIPYQLISSKKIPA